MAHPNRQCIIIGNWKMYQTVDASLKFLKALTPLVHDAACAVYLAAPFTSLALMAKEAQNTNVVIGAQNMHDASEGAFTGEISAKMLVSAGAKFVILGHSERRRLFHEDNAFINRKVIRALQNGLQPVLCIGESLEEKNNGDTEKVLQTQLSECLASVTKDQLSNTVIAYEPVWAIGSDLPATPETAEHVHKQCRDFLSEKWSADVAQKVSILYGGSVKPDNAAAFLDQADIDGLLVGGASLSPETFSQIIHCKKNKTPEPISEPS